MIRLSLILLAAMTLPVHAQHQHSPSQPAEVGQATFAALAEIVEMLRDNPDTDWQLVDIPALRQHLVDMDLLMMNTSVATEMNGSGIVFTISGEERTVQTIHRMVPAHAPFLDAATGWTTSVVIEPTGAVMTIDGDTDVVTALGFYGVMTIGAHHQEHHLAMATGRSVHH
ncbi:hypothetical protein A8B78_12880 [Jannaschia sp. EhC01]|nr:hypothetical protein A8B78_12880 [Jannaschia sp. EhC01]